MSNPGILHITNGDSTAERLRQTGLPGEILAWRDELHEGPAPAHASLRELSALRVEYFASTGIASLDQTHREFAERDALLERAPTYKHIVLWFEHDLYDQLQLIQILDWFAAHEGAELSLSLICIGSFPGIPRFHGLGQLTPAQLRTLTDRRRRVTQAELDVARQAWAAYTAPTPKGLETMMRGSVGALPFLRAAIIRHLEDFPAVHGGLSRTEKQIVEVIRDGAHAPFDIFIAAQERESNPFLGDATVWRQLRFLSSCEAPLLEAEDGAFMMPGPGKPSESFLRQSISLTDLGREVVAGRTDWIAVNGIDRWLGGVHLVGHHVPWRWDERRGKLIASP